MAWGSQFCQIDDDGCATDGVDNHGGGENCVIRVNTAGPLTAVQFDVEPSNADSECSGCNCDYVQIGGTQYCGTNGPYSGQYSGTINPTAPSRTSRSCLCTWNGCPERADDLLVKTNELDPSDPHLGLSRKRSGVAG